MVKTQQTPRRLVRDHRVTKRHQHRVQRDKTKQRGATFRNRPTRHKPQADQRQQENHQLAEHRSVCELMEAEQTDIIMPRMFVDVHPTGAFQIIHVSEYRVGDTAGVAKKRGKQRHRHRRRRQQHQRSVSRPDPFYITSPLPAPPPGVQQQQQRAGHRTEGDHKRLLGGVHQPKASPRQQGPRYRRSF